jgi:hypothetical protein
VQYVGVVRSDRLARAGVAEARAPTPVPSVGRKAGSTLPFSYWISIKSSR